MRRYVFFPALAAAFALFAVAAGAAWLASGNGSSFTRSTSLGKPTSVAATATGTSSVQVTWNAPAAPSPAPTSYDVFRYNGGTGTKVCSAVPAGPSLVCNDSGLSPSTTYGYTVESRLGDNWMSGQTTQVDATTNAPAGTPNFLVELVTAGNKTAGTAFDVRVTARNNTTTDTTYTGSHNLTFSGPGQNTGFAAPSYPASGTFAAGVATVNVTLRKAETVSLAVSEGARTGSTSVTVVAGAATQLVFTNSTTTTGSSTTEVPVSCTFGCTVSVDNNGTFTATVTRLDASGNAATGAQIQVDLTRSTTDRNTLTPTQLTIPLNGSESTGSFTVKLLNGSPDVTVTAGSGTLTTVAVRVKK